MDPQGHIYVQEGGTLKDKTLDELREDRERLKEQQERRPVLSATVHRSVVPGPRAAKPHHVRKPSRTQNTKGIAGYKR